MKKKNFLNSIRRPFLQIVTGALCLHSLSTFGQSETANNEDKTLSPYFVVISDESENPKLPLKSTYADVNITGVIADVKVTQEYQNTGTTAIEAIYVFPASTRAAVYNMKMTIGEREIIAVIKKKQEARAQYEQAKEEGKSASLLEQKRPNVFQMNVANIMPGDLIKVELSYTELLIPEDGVYEFAYPTVVGPRYSNQSHEDTPEDEEWVSNPYTKEGTAPSYGFDIRVHIAAGLPLHNVRCKSHEVDINYKGESQADISLKNAGGKEGNRDYVLQYRLAGNQIESGLLLYEGKEENFFLAMMQPPKRVKIDEIPPREYIFILDISGSMSGFPLDVSKELMRNLLGKLRPVDRFNVIVFAGSSGLLSEKSLQATPENINNALNNINNLRGGGGTNLLPALRKALSIKGTENYSRSFVIATDGYVTVEKEAFELIRANLDKANFFSFGIGSSVNRYIIEGMAHAGCGEPFIVLNSSEASAKATKLMEYIQSPVLTNIKVEYGSFDVYDVEPLSVPDILAQRPVILYGKWRGKPTGEIKLTGLSGKGRYSKSLSVQDAQSDDKHSALRYLWARKKIRLMDDFIKVTYDDEHKKEITALGLKYNLLTNYTSFIAVDSEVRNQSGETTTIKQPLPLPQGVSNNAIGYAAKSMSYNRPAYKSGTKRLPVKESEVVLEDKDEAVSPEAFDKTLEEDAVFVNVDKQPTFTDNGIEGLKKFISKHFNHPKGITIKGTVYIEFVVNKDGSISSIKVLRSVHPEIDKEAIRVIKLTGKKWTAGIKDGKKVKTRMVIPVKI